MYNNILIISDNAFLCYEFKKLIKNTGLDESSFHFSISPQSDIKDFKEDKFDVVNLKEDGVVENIIISYDLVFSIHCKQIFPKKMIRSVKCINIHPGYNPINRGWYPQVFAIIYDLPIGVTIHEIDEFLDHGEIIAREYVAKFEYDTSETLYNRILQKEIELLKRHLPNIILNQYQLKTPESQGNLFLKSDFNDLLEIDLNQQFKAGDLINRLRALTHGSFKNAYFVDKLTGKKIYIGINLEIESS